MTLAVEQMREGVSKVRDVLGPGISIKDKEIEDSLWHYYYDVEKSVNYILSMYYTLLAETCSDTSRSACKPRAAEIKGEQ